MTDQNPPQQPPWGQQPQSGQYQPQPGYGQQPPPVHQPGYPPPPPPRKKAGKGVLIGCGGLLGLFILILIIVSVAAAAGRKSSGSGSGGAAASSAPAATTAPAGATSSAAPGPTQTTPAAPQYTVAQQQAIQAAQGYLSDGEGFSRAGLIQQLDSPDGSGFTHALAVFAVKHIQVNWDQQAVIAAKGYMSDGEGFSYSSLVQQLDSSYGSGFTYAQAVYAAKAVGL
jgi:Host cell surface-exposed lipoprotein